MSIKLGMEVKLYYDPADVGGSSWSELTNVKDLTFNLEKEVPDGRPVHLHKTVGDANGCWTRTAGQYRAGWICWKGDMGFPIREKKDAGDES